MIRQKNQCRPLSRWPPRSFSGAPVAGSCERSPSRGSFPWVPTQRREDQTTLVLRADLVGRPGGRDARLLIATIVYGRHPSSHPIKRVGEQANLVLLNLVRLPGQRDARLLIAGGALQRRPSKGFFHSATLVLLDLVVRPGGGETRLMTARGAGLRLPKLRLLAPVVDDAFVAGAERAGEDGTLPRLHLPTPLRLRHVTEAERTGDVGVHLALHRLRLTRRPLPHIAHSRYCSVCGGCVHAYIGGLDVCSIPIEIPVSIYSANNQCGWPEDGDALISKCINAMEVVHLDLIRYFREAYPMLKYMGLYV